VTGLAIERFEGAAIRPYLAALASLRIEVFREYPYLYEGSLEYEQRYLESYAACPRSVVVLARADAQVVGASTALPLTAHGEGLAPVFAAADIDPERVFYLGESVLRAAYRGQGAGHAFFDQREAAARAHGYTLCAFCAVERPVDHPARPAGYVPHDAFWQKRGYRRTPTLATSFSWRDLGDGRDGRDVGESEKRMVFWLKELAT
jgi:GNAT superfamily N-acetyltransferase